MVGNWANKVNDIVVQLLRAKFSQRLHIQKSNVLDTLVTWCGNLVMDYTSGHRLQKLKLLNIIDIAIGPLTHANKNCFWASTHYDDPTAEQPLSLRSHFKEGKDCFTLQ